MNSDRDLTRQLVVIHLSDVHFGKTHRFNPPESASGDTPDEDAYPTLLEKLQEDLHGQDPQCPLIICNTGDFAQTAAIDEFKQAEKFVMSLANTPILGKKRGIKNTFLVPGNHDVVYDHSDVGDRWQQYTEFHNRVYSSSIRRENPWEFAAVHDRIDDLGVIVLCLNSSIYVEKGKPDEDRGRLDIKQLTAIEQALEDFDQKRLHSAIKLALIHHHPVLIPALAEPGRGYDAVHNSGKLLTILRRFGFHVVLHGHKHNPHTFTDDAKPAHQDLSDQPILLAAGGSIGSTGLPYSPRALNCYNQVVIKWHPNGKQFRVRVTTRALNIFNADGTERLPTRWQWETLRIDDRHFFDADRIPFPGTSTEREFDASVDSVYEKQRVEQYENTRGNLPVVEVLPSLIPNQAYEAILWIVPHPFGETKKDEDIPTTVTWTAGERFEVVSVSRQQDPTFCARLTYWGPMLVQARMQFEDGHEAIGYVYARMPKIYSAVDNQ